MQRPLEKRSKYRRAYLKEAWESFDAMFPITYRPGSVKKKFDTIHRRWVHLFYQITKHAEDSGIELTALWAEGGWLFDAASKREPARLTHSALRKVNRNLGILDECDSVRKNLDSSLPDVIVDLRDGSSQVSASELDHSTSLIAEEQIKSESESESESGCYSDSTYDERAHLTLRVTRSSSRPKTPRPSSDLPGSATSAAQIKAEPTDSPTAPIRVCRSPSPILSLSPPPSSSPMQTIEYIGRFMSSSPGGPDTQVSTSSHTSTKRRFDQIESSPENPPPDMPLGRRARRRRITTSEPDQESIASTQRDQPPRTSVETPSAKEAFKEAFARWSTFAKTEKNQDTGDKLEELGDCEKELRRLEERLELAQQKDDKTYQQIEAIGKLIATAAPDRNERDAIGIGEQTGEAWAYLLATAERTREVLEGEAQEQVEELSTAVEAMREDVARLTNEAEMQRLVKVVAKGMEDLSGLFEKRR